MTLLYAIWAFGSFSLPLNGILIDTEINLNNILDPPLVALTKEFNPEVLVALVIFPYFPFYLLSHQLMHTYSVLCPQAQFCAQT